MSRRYSDEELRVLRDIIRENGHLVYDPEKNGYDVSKEFRNRSGSRRASAALYMLGWRIEKGDYSHRGISI